MRCRLATRGFSLLAICLLGLASCSDEAQHDPELRVDPVDVAYLEDRVAVNRGRPQTYGSQIRCMEGRPEPATPIEDAGNVDARRKEVGLDPLDDYYAELEEACAAEAAGT
ncbi:MAG TPA: DUF6624 domain-containing protein [Actinomycetota bacterium]